MRLRTRQEPTLILLQQTAVPIIRERTRKLKTVNRIKVMLLAAGRVGNTGPRVLFLVDVLVLKQEREFVMTQLQHMAVQSTLEQMKERDPVAMVPAKI